MDNRSYSKGISWIDDCRIPFVDDGLVEHQKKYSVYKKKDGDSLYGFQDRIGNRIGGSSIGRFLANLLVCDDMLNDGTTSKTNNGKRHNKTTQMFYGKGEHYYTGDKGTNSRYYDIDKWFDKILNN